MAGRSRVMCSSGMSADEKDGLHHRRARPGRSAGGGPRSPRRRRPGPRATCRGLPSSRRRRWWLGLRAENSRHIADWTAGASPWRPTADARAATEAVACSWASLSHTIQNPTSCAFFVVEVGPVRSHGERRELPRDRSGQSRKGSICGYSSDWSRGQHAGDPRLGSICGQSEPLHSCRCACHPNWRRRIGQRLGKRSRPGPS